ncbi:MAG: acyl-CoA--6-aminopenicillanic acid acyltransferase [Lachnospiraceae bacterium]|nr:acyl-CoA--6-aminopenicillanic acid acyltransferase [Lachnospiraceae bacterium]
MRKFQLIEVKAKTAYERGFQYGEQAKDKIKASVEDYRILFGETSTMSWSEIQNYALDFVPISEKFIPEVVEEAKGIAAGAGVSLEDVMVLNARYEITKFPKPNECTSFSVLPEATKHKGTYVGQNWDYRVGIMDNIVMVHIEEENGTRIFGLAEAGQVIRNGFNSNGIGLCANNLQSCYDKKGLGIPVTFLRRQVLSSKTFEEAKEWLVNAERSVSCNFMLASKDGKAIDVEAHPKGADILEPKAGILTHANHFVHRPEIHALEFSPRGNRLYEKLAEKTGEIDIAYIAECLSDHENYPKALCRHPSDVSVRLGRRGITVAGVIYDFENETAYVCAGPPCEGEFIPYKL